MGKLKYKVCKYTNVMDAYGFFIYSKLYFMSKDFKLDWRVMNCDSRVVYVLTDRFVSLNFNVVGHVDKLICELRKK